MDKNKLQVLRELPFKIHKVCGLCKHGVFKQDWGMCSNSTYSHLKHTGPERQLSIHRFGSCPKFEESSSVDGLGAYKEFL